MRCCLPPDPGPSRLPALHRHPPQQRTWFLSLSSGPCCNPISKQQVLANKNCFCEPEVTPQPHCPPPPPDVDERISSEESSFLFLRCPRLTSVSSGDAREAHTPEARSLVLWGDKTLGHPPGVGTHRGRSLVCRFLCTHTELKHRPMGGVLPWQYGHHPSYADRP